MKGKTSKFIFLLPVFMLIIIFIYNSLYPPIYVLLGVPVSFFLISYFYYDRMSIYLTGSSVYVFKNGEPIFNSNLVENFKLLDIEETKIGKYLNYGTFIIVNQDDKFFSYKFLEDPYEFKKQVIKRYYKLMQKKDPGFSLPQEIYEEVFGKKENKKIDSLDSLGEYNETKEQ